MLFFFFFCYASATELALKNNEKEIIAKDSQMVELKSLCLTHMPPLFLRRAVTFFFSKCFGKVNCSTRAMKSSSAAGCFSEVRRKNRQAEKTKKEGEKKRGCVKMTLSSRTTEMLKKEKTITHTHKKKKEPRLSFLFLRAFLPSFFFIGLIAFPFFSDVH